MIKRNPDYRYGETEINLLRRFRAKVLLSSFNGKDNDVFRAVHNFKDNQFFFADYSKDFFYKTHILLRSGMISYVYRLLVYKNVNEIYSDDSQRIINFHSSHERYFYKLISEKDYNFLIRENNIHQAIDFGIFGIKRVYRTRIDTPDFILFTWSKRTREIKKYLKFFKICWNSEKAYRLDHLHEPT